MGGMDLEQTLGDLRYKEVINITDGCRYGYPRDIAVNLEVGRIAALIIPGRLRLFGLLGREEDLHIPWERVRQIGEDIILVEGRI